ncbi:MAG: erythromycin esterase family protein [Crocinitomicaceae bacterium]|nr:erythromycin esterase family protein [Flavobacteriales bacterium]NQZ34781.1 erythromycin esterase family protein [Crocinitomicaceae bacterium]
MRKLSTCLLVFFFHFFGEAVFGQQESHIWFQSNLTELTDYSALDELVADKKYVFLGESSHGAKEFFKEKSAIIQYLIENHNFEVVLFESPIVASYLYDLYPEKRIDSISHCEHVLYPIFVNDDFIQLMDYLDSSDISVSGFDIQLGTEFQSRFITEIVYNTFAEIDTSIAESFLEVDKIHTQDYLVAFSKKHKWYKNAYHSRGTLDECNYWMKQYQLFYSFFKSNEADITQYFNGNTQKTHMIENALLANISAINDHLIGELYYRDSLMFDNIEYLLREKYQGKKVIFSAHNAHIAKNFHKMNDTIIPSDLTFGNRFNRKYENKTCVIALYGIDGSTNDNIRRPIEMTATTHETSLEYNLKENVLNSSIVNLTPYPFTESNGFVDLYHWGTDPQTMIPNQQYDAIIFIKTLSPSVYEDH